MDSELLWLFPLLRLGGFHICVLLCRDSLPFLVLVLIQDCAARGLVMYPVLLAFDRLRIQIELSMPPHLASLLLVW